MKRFTTTITVLLTMTVAFLGGQNTVAASGNNNFVIKNYKVDLNLAKDGENRSILETTETIVAEFPNSNQNHGIERSLVTTFDGHKTSLDVQSVTNQNGENWNYKINDKNIMRIGDANRYIHGEQTFIIKYSQRDVTKFYQNTGRNEFYWNAIGTEWQVPIESAEVRVNLTENVADAWTGDVHCYLGAQGSNKKCLANSTRESKPQNFTFLATNLQVREGMTVAFGFKEGTFAGYKKSKEEKIFETVKMMVAFSNLISLIILPIIATIFLKKRRKMVESGEVGKALHQATIPQYLPPKDYSVLESSQVFRNKVESTALTGQVIDWAVRHMVTISQTNNTLVTSAEDHSTDKMRHKTVFHQSKGVSLNLSEVDYIIEKVGDFSSKDVDLSKIIFTKTNKVSLISLRDEAEKITNFLSNKSSEIIGSDLYCSNEEAFRYSAKIGKTMLFFGLVTASLPFLFLSAMAYFNKYARDLSVKGAELKKYLEGLEMYISVAEEERLKMLQSPETAQKVGDVSSDKGTRLKLYERVLPYAILFGQEKEWTKQLGDLYVETGQSPDWNVGAAAFSAAAFSSAMSDFSANISSASDYSSDSGGSSGGGSSGGGGGGGW